jgi:hypothetical protein
MPNGDNIRQPNPVEILQTSPSADDDDDNLLQISSSNVNNLDDSNTEELSFFVGTIKFGRARKCVIGRQTQGHRRTTWCDTMLLLLCCYFLLGDVSVL